MPYATDVLTVLRHLGAPSLPELGPEAQRAFAQACRADDPIERLRRGARAAGLELSRHRVTLPAIAISAPALPLLLHSAEQEAYVALEGVRRGRIQVRLFTERGPGTASWVEVEALAGLLGVPADRALQVYQPIHQRPLDALRGSTGVGWDRLFALLAPEKRDLWVVVVYAVAVGLLTLATPLAVQSLINTVAFGTVLQPLVVLGLLLMAALAASAVLRLFELVVVELLARRVFARTTVDFSRRLPAARRDAGPGQLQTLVNRFYDVVVVDKTVTSLIFDGLSALLQIGLGLMLLAVYHPLLLAFDLVMIVIIAVIIFGLGRGAISTAKQESKKKHEVAAFLEVLAGTPATFRSVTGQHYAHARADELLQGWLQARASHFRIVLRQQGGMLGLQAVASAALVLIGGFLVLERQLTLGQLVAAEVIMTLTVSALGKIGKLLAKLYDLLAALDKMGAVIDLPMSPLGGEALDASLAPLSVQVRHPTLDLDVGPGEHVALAGADLVDEHGLVDWITGLRPVEGGTLRFDGVDARGLAVAELAEQVILLEPREVFEGTIRDNVSLGDPSVSSSTVRSALAAVGLGQLDLAQGIDTPLDRDGAPLADGQRALLLVARAIALRPRLVVVDRLLDPLSPPLRRRALDVLLAPEAPWTAICVTDQRDVDERFKSSVRPRGPTPVEHRS